MRVIGVAALLWCLFQRAVIPGSGPGLADWKARKRPKKCGPPVDPAARYTAIQTADQIRSDQIRSDLALAQRSTKTQQASTDQRERARHRYLDLFEALILERQFFHADSHVIVVFVVPRSGDVIESEENAFSEHLGIRSDEEIDPRAAVEFRIASVHSAAIASAREEREGQKTVARAVTRARPQGELEAIADPRCVTAPVAEDRTSAHFEVIVETCFEAFEGESHAGGALVVQIGPETR